MLGLIVGPVCERVMSMARSGGGNTADSLSVLCMVSGRRAYRCLPGVWVGNDWGVVFLYVPFWLFWRQGGRLGVRLDSLVRQNQRTRFLFWFLAIGGMFSWDYLSRLTIIM